MTTSIFKITYGHMHDVFHFFTNIENQCIFDAFSQNQNFTTLSRINSTNFNFLSFWPSDETFQI